MAFCNSCGANLPDGTKFCSKCGAIVAAPVAAAPAIYAGHAVRSSARFRQQQRPQDHPHHRRGARFPIHLRRRRVVSMSIHRLKQRGQACPGSAGWRQRKSRHALRLHAKLERPRPGHKRHRHRHISRRASTEVRRIVRQLRKHSHRHRQVRKQRLDGQGLQLL